MRKFWSTLVAVLFSGGIAAAAFIPILSPNNPAGIACSEPSQSLYCYNQIIGTVNSYLGLVAAQPGAVNGAALTSEQTLATTTLPGGTLGAAGQSLIIRCNGTTSSAGHNNTAKLYFGQYSFSSGTMSTASASWELELLITATSTTASVGNGRGTFSTTVIAPTVTVDSVDVLTGGIVAKCTGTQGTASAADIVLDNFIVEQVK